MHVAIQAEKKTLRVRILPVTGIEGYLVFIAYMITQYFNVPYNLG